MEAWAQSVWWGINKCLFEFCWIIGTSVVIIESSAWDLQWTVCTYFLSRYKMLHVKLDKPPETAVVKVYVMQTEVTIFSVQILSNVQSIAPSAPVVNNNNKIIQFTSCSEQVEWSVQPNLAASKISSNALPSGLSHSSSLYMADMTYWAVESTTRFRPIVQNANGTETLIGSTTSSLIVYEAPTWGESWEMFCLCSRWGRMQHRGKSHIYYLSHFLPVCSLGRPSGNRIFPSNWPDFSHSNFKAIIEGLGLRV